MITLPDRNGDEGVEARVLLAECQSPAFNSYTIEAAKECMQLMDAVLWNRMKNPGPFMAKGAKSLKDVVKARNQFAGFEAYPNYDNSIRLRIQSALDIANNSKDRRSAVYGEFVNAAIDIAKSAAFSDPSPGRLVAWRTTGSGLPGSGFIKYKTVLGNDFYYQ